MAEPTQPGQPLEISIKKSFVAYGGKDFASFENGSGVTVQIYEGQTLLAQRDMTYAEYAVFQQEALPIPMPDYPDPQLNRRSGGTNANGNTIGRVVGETAPTSVPGTQANLPIEAETDKEGITGKQVLDGVQLGLDVVGLIPVFGETADLANAGVSASRGDYVGAGLSLLSAIPFVGYAGTAGKATRYGSTMVNAAGKKTGGKTKGKKKIDPCAALQNGVPSANYRGGKHGNIKRGGNSYTPRRESHHIPADSAYSKINGKVVSSDAKPSIQLDVTDHYATASWGSTGKQYSKIQEKLIQGGKAGYRAAMMMDIEDIRSKFGSKYDAAITQMLAWAKCKEYI